MDFFVGYFLFFELAALLTIRKYTTAVAELNFLFSFRFLGYGMNELKERILEAKEKDYNHLLLLFRVNYAVCLATLFLTDGFYLGIQIFVLQTALVLFNCLFDFSERSAQYAAMTSKIITIGILFGYFLA